MLYNPVVSPTTGKILQPTLMPPGTVALEVFSICLPPDSPDLVKSIWAEVDEQDFPVDNPYAHGRDEISERNGRQRPSLHQFFQCQA